MPSKFTQNVSLTPELQHLLSEKVASGHYRTTSEVVRAALRLFLETTPAEPPVAHADAGPSWSEQQLAALFAQSAAGLAVVDLTGRFTWVNERYCTIVGRAPEELLQLRMQDVTHPEDLSGNLALFAQAAANDRSFEIEKRYVRPDGSLVWVNNSVSPVRSAAGQPQSILAVCVDITSRKQVEATLRRTEALKGAILDAALDCIVTVTADSRVVEWNPAAERTFGYSREEALDQDLAQLIIPQEFRERHYRGMNHYLTTGYGPVLRKRIELEALRADGSRFPVELAISPIEIEGQPHFTAYLRDISEGKRIEAALRQSEQRLHSTYEHAFAGIAEMDANGRYLRVNEQFTQITGYSREELLQRSFLDITYPDDAGIDLEQFRRQMMGEIETYTVEKRYIHKAGHAVWIELAASRVDDEDGRPLYGIRVVRDISERKRAEEANARLAAIVSSSADAIDSLSAEDGRILTWNKGAEALFGYTEDEAVGSPVGLLVAPDHLTELENERGIFDRAMADGHIRIDTVRRRKDGTLVDVAISAARMEDAQGRVLGVSVIFRDITERKRWEQHQQLLLNELNHRVKNTLATVQSIASQTLRSAPSLGEAKEAFEARLMALSRVHDVLTRESWEAANLSEIISQAVAPYRGAGDARFHCDGSDIRVSPRIALALAMTLQELATNAVKYGALSNATGCVDLTWRVRDTVEGPRLRLQWVEAGGPPVGAPKRRGFGSRLIERSLAQDLRGKVSLRFEPSGLICDVDALLASAVDEQVAA